ncbi:MAG: histidine kinase [Leptospira sp.]|nr:histidine kinase [Leptospira sp.]
MKIQHVYQVAFWILINFVIGTLNALLISFNSPRPFWNVFLSTQITTHTVCSLVEISIYVISGRLKKKPSFLNLTVVFTGSIVSAFFGVALGGLFHAILFRSRSTPEGHDDSYNILISSVLLAIVITSIDRYVDYLNFKRHESEKALRDIHLKALQNRMSPHFLFNALNTIHSLLQISPEKADMALMILADNYRFLSAKSFDELIPFEEEWKFIENYLGLEKLRFEDTLEIKMEKEGDFSGVRIPPLTIQPIIENCFKHGLRDRAGNGLITIKAKNFRNEIRIRITDNGSGIMEVDRRILFRNTLGNILSRLEFNFPESEMKLNNSPGGGAVAEIKFRI